MRSRVGWWTSVSNSISGSRKIEIRTDVVDGESDAEGCKRPPSKRGNMRERSSQHEQPETPDVEGVSIRFPDVVRFEELPHEEVGNTDHRPTGNHGVVEFAHRLHDSIEGRERDDQRHHPGDCDILPVHPTRYSRGGPVVACDDPP